MAPRLTSPTSLLWAHQLKREHGFLLQRMQKLETMIEDHEARLKNIESATRDSSDPKIEELAEQVKELNESGINKRIENMERNVAEKLEDVQAESEAHTLQIESLQKDQQMADEDRKKAMGKDQALLKRIGEIEAGLQKYETSLDRRGKRIDEARLEQIKTALDDLTQQIRREGEQMKWLTESLTALEAANAELTKANKKSELELSKMAAKLADNERKKANEKATAANAETETQTTPGADQERPQKKKSHKWDGGGADKDIIRQGLDLFRSPNTLHRSPPKKMTKEPSTKKPARAPAPPVPKKKSQAPPPKPQRFISNHSDGTPKKSHRWTGSGADKEVKQAGLSFDADRKRTRSSDVASTDTPKKRPHTSVGGSADKGDIRVGSSPLSNPQPSHSQKQNEHAKQSRKTFPLPEGDENVLRAGKGWIEVAVSQTEESNASTSVPQEKRKRGRPRKANITPKFTDEELTQGRVTRRGIQQIQEKQHSKGNNSLISEILGDLQYAPIVQELVANEPSMSREKLEYLKQILEENPRARTEFKALARHLDEENQPTTKKRTADSAFEAIAPNAADNHSVKKIKREESLDSATTDSIQAMPRVYTSAVSSQASDTEVQQPEGNESKGSVLGVVTSQREEAVPKPRRQITQIYDMVL